MRRGRKAEAAQCGIQGASGDGGAFGGEDPGGVGGGVSCSSDDDQQLEAGAGETSDRAVCARQQGAGGRGCAEGDRRSAPEDRTAAGRVRFSCWAARHLPIAEARCSRRRAAASTTGLGRNLPRNSSFWSGSTGVSPTIPSTAAVGSRWRSCDRGFRLAAGASGG